MTSNAPAQRFRIDLAYDGRSYEGWGSQVSGNTVQDSLQRALQKICSSITGAQGSGRTDAGVSAVNQVAHFDAPLNWRMKPQEWLKALNANLPPTIRVHGCFRVAPDFHARFSALEKTYRYEIFTGPVLPPLKVRLAWHQPRLSGVPDEKLARAMDLFVGEHDFRSFSANRNDGKDEDRNTVRSVTAAVLSRPDNETLWLRFSGNGFLYKMVRFLVATVVTHGLEKIPQSAIISLLAGETPKKKAPLCAPPDGLILENVRYGVEVDGISRE